MKHEPTPAMRARALLANAEAVKSLTEDVINAIALTVQNKIGQTDGGVASLYFADEEPEGEIENIIRMYLSHEAVYADEDELEQNAEARAEDAGTDPIDERAADQDAADRAVAP